MNNSYKGLSIDLPDTDGRFALIQVRNVTRSEPARFVLSERYGRKNLSGAPCARGWLGCTNDVTLHACGVVEVYRDAAGRRRVKQLEDSDLPAEDVGAVGS